jgi:hypothetical protein
MDRPVPMAYRGRRGRRVLMVRRGRPALQAVHRDQSGQPGRWGQRDQLGHRDRPALTVPFRDRPEQRDRRGRLAQLGRKGLLVHRVGSRKRQVTTSPMGDVMRHGLVF